MTFAKSALTLASALWMFSSGCADVSGDDQEAADAVAATDTDPLAQIQWEGEEPSTGMRPGGSTGATGSTGTGAPRRPRGTTTQPTTPTRPTRPTTPPRPTAPSTGGGSSNGSVNLRDPNGVYFTDVSATGSGCPKGSWNVSLAPDGKTFTITFSEYELQFDDTDPADALDLDCRITLKLHSPKGVSYAVSDISYSGYAFLDPGVIATHSNFYSFSGVSLPSVNGVKPRGTVTKQITGPYDNSYTFTDRVVTSDLVFSQCGTTRDLNVNTSIQLINPRRGNNGYLNLAAIDGRTKGVFKFTLTNRPC